MYKGKEKKNHNREAAITLAAASFARSWTARRKDMPADYIQCTFDMLILS